MTALSADRDTPRKDGIEVAYPVYTGVKIYAGSLVCVNTGHGYAIPGADASGNLLVGVAQETVDNTDGDSGAVSIRVRRKGLFRFAGSTLTQAKVGTTMYVSDDQTVASTSSHAVVAGRLVEYVSATVGWLDIDCAVYATATMAATAVTLADAGNYTTAAQVEAAIQEIYAMLKGSGYLQVPLSVWRVVATNDIPGAASNGGLPAKDTDPLFEAVNGDTDQALRLNWAVDSVVPVVAQIPLPPDLDTTSDLVLHLLAYLGGTTDTVDIASDAYFGLGDTKVEDSLDAALNAATATELTITIAAADIPVGAQTITIELTPGAHANDALYLLASWFEYGRRLPTGS